MSDKAANGLKKLIKRRCTTIFIGSLDSIEQKFGRQWGDGKDADQLTEKEKHFLQLWKELRKEILDKGNAQTKSLLAELELFEVDIKQYYYKIGLEQ